MRVGQHAEHGDRPGDPLGVEALEAAARHARRGAVADPPGAEDEVVAKIHVLAVAGRVDGGAEESRPGEEVGACDLQPAEELTPVSGQIRDGFVPAHR